MREIPDGYGATAVLDPSDGALGGAQEQLKSEIAAWERQRNASGARIKRMFTIDKAREMGKVYQTGCVRELRSKSHNHCAEVQFRGLGSVIPELLGLAS